MYQLLNSGMNEILELFYKNKSKKLYFREVVKKTSLKEPSVLNYLRRLEKFEYLNSEKKGNMKYYFLNHKNPFVIHYLTSFDKKYLETLPFIIKKILTKVRQSFDNNFIIIFGSYAKGNFDKKSDLDIFVCVKNDKLIEKNSIIKDLEDEYGIKIDFHIGKIENSQNQKHIFETGVPITNFENFYEVYFNDIK